MKRSLLALASWLAACGSDAPPAGPPVVRVPEPVPPPVPEPTPAPAPAPEAIGLGSPSTGRACTRDDECVLVTGLCDGPLASHRDDAAELDAQHERMLSIGECAGRASYTPVRVGCDGHCVTVPLDHEDWRRCTSDGQCVAEHRDCQRWEAVSRAHRDEAHAAFTGAACPGIVPPQPPVRCRYGTCIAGWWQE